MRTSSIRQDAIAPRAYELFVARGEAHGNDVDDWLQAELELEEQATLRLSAYGQLLGRYHGRGILFFANSETQAVNFDAGQLFNGDTLLLTSSTDVAATERFMMSWGGGEAYEPVRFSGTADAGLSLVADIGFSTNYLPETLDQGTYGAYELRDLSVSFPQSGPVAEYRFGLVNFHFVGTQRVTVNRQGRKHHVLGIPIPLVVSGMQLQGMIVPTPNASSEHTRVITTKSHGILAELIVRVDEQLDPVELNAAVDDLCLVLSVARGTRVRAIYREELSASDAAPQRILHRSRSVKRYCPLAPIDDDYDQRDATQHFVNIGISKLPNLRHRYAIDRGVVDAYLDAKAEADFLETRGTKIAAAIEKLKTEFLRGSPSSVAEFIVPSAEFNSALDSLQAAAEKSLVDHGIDAELAKRIVSADKLRGLNRTSFRQVVKAIRDDVKLTVSSKEVDLFIASRDHLVHMGQFYCDCATSEERLKLAPLPDARTEFFFLVSFLDRVFLKLFGYSGKYTDWRNFPGKELLGELK